MNRSVKIQMLLVLVTCFAFRPQAGAWGHRLELRTHEAREALLGDIAIQKHEIRFCVAIDESVALNFDADSIRTQTQAALQAWLNPVQQARLITTTNLHAVDCESNNFHLKIAVGPDTRNPGTSSSSRILKSEVSTFLDVRINTDYRSERENGIIDFMSLMRLESQSELISVLDRLSLVQGFSTEAFAKHSGLNEAPVFWSTFRILLHEVGHAFGLCETTQQTVELECDPEHRTAVYSQSVMSDSKYVSLTKDDELGITELFRRLRRAPLKP